MSVHVVQTKLDDKQYKIYQKAKGTRTNHEFIMELIQNAKRTV